MNGGESVASQSLPHTSLRSIKQYSGKTLIVYVGVSVLNLATSSHMAIWTSQRAFRAADTSRRLPLLSEASPVTSLKTEASTNMLESGRLRDLRWILLGLVCFCRQMPGTCAEKVLKLDPTSIVVLFGSPASVNCSTNVTHHQGMGWEATQGTVPKQKNVQLITWSVERLEQWDIQPMCFINIKNQHSEALNITVYKPPEWVFISAEGHAEPMFEDSVYEIKCVVQDVAPVRLLNVNWYKGDQLIKSNVFSEDNNTFPANAIATLQISPHRSDDGVQYRCEAELKLGPEGPQLPPTMTSDPLNITVHYGPEVSNCPDVVHLQKGMSLAGYCIVTGNPFPDSSWERDGLTIDPSFPLDRTASGEYNFIVNGDIKKSLMVEVIYGPEITCGKHYTVREDDNFDPNCTVEGHPSFEMFWHKDEDLVDFPISVHKTDAGQYVLIATNVYINVSHSVEIEVLYPPSRIMELQATRVSVGEDVVLKCASNAKPRPRYDWIYHETSNVIIKDQDGVSLLYISHAGSENTGIYLCIASNDLGKANRMVRVDVQGAEPWCPLSFNPPRVLLEYGETVNVKCSTNATDARLSWKFANSVIVNDTLVINSSTLSDFLDGNLKATCRGSFVGLDDCQQDLAVTIYKRPEKVSISTVDHAGPMIEGKNYTLRCDVQNVAPVHLLTVNWYKGNYCVRNESYFSGTEYLANKTATLTIFPSRNDNITSYSCDAELKLGLKSSTTVKSNPFNITVHYKPAIHKKSPQWVPVFHGYSEVLVCKASGYPAPTITWIYNNGKFEGENLTIKANAGEYTCIASNSVGNDTRVVNVVLKDTHCELVLRPSELLLEYGASASVDCFTATPIRHLGMGWKAPQGAVDMIKDVQLITWKVDSLVHWVLQPICYLDLFAGECHVELPVTVYKLPDRVSISTVGHAGPVIEGKQYELQCDVYNVAPVHLLTVNWYKGQHLVQKTSFSDSTKTPVNQSTRFHMSLNRADDGVRYRCEAELKLSRTKTGAQTSSKVTSQVLGLNVHYSPQVSSVVEIFNETTEDVALNCTVTANPPPTYTWHSANTGKEFNIGHPVLDLSFLRSGNYTCTASNGIGSIRKLFIVQAKPRGGNRTTFWAIVGPFVGLAVVMIVGYVLVKRRTIKK